jgi:hypothetical protein
VGISGQFGMAVAAGNQGTASYFQLNVLPGRLAAAAALIANLGDKTETLAIGHAAGITAANGGSAYRPASNGCAGPGCWVTGLPRLITLPAHRRELLAFTVRVPATTPPGQYLTGISAQRTTASGAMKVGSNRNSPSKAVVVEVVTIGVAVTVGDLSAMTTRLRIAAVQGTAIGHLARINIRLDNTGQTFSRAAGAASCAADGRQRTYSVRAGTVLPHDNALIIVNTPALPLGATVPCAILLRYGSGQVVRWTGVVTIPGALAVHFAHTGNGVYTQIPQPGTPAWAVGLISVSSAALLAGVSVLLFRRRRLR